MLSITVRSMLEELSVINGESEIIIVDNSDYDIYKLISTPKSSPLAHHYLRTGKIRLLRQDYPCFFSAAMKGFQEANGDYIFHTDSHMLIGHDTFKDLVKFAESKPQNGLFYAPIGWCGQHESIARHAMRMNTDNIYAGWGDLFTEPTKITWNFGSWIANRNWFLNTIGGYGFFENKKLSWGGGQFYTAMKSWLLGYENWAVPTRPIYHIGPFSKELATIAKYAYRVYGDSGNTKVGIGILAAFYAIAGEDGKEFAYIAEPGMKKHHGIDVDQYWDEAKSLAFEDRQWIKERQVMTLREFWENKIWESGAKTS
jgi:hypothetical protein